MQKRVQIIFIILMSLVQTTAIADPSRPGTKGQNYDTLLFDNANDGDVSLTARIMTLPQSANSSSTIEVTDNGVSAFGPRSDPAERWSQRILIRGKGRHEVTLVCRNTNAKAVYCSLDPDDAAVEVIEHRF